jgi:hypothetical protein
MVTTQSKQIPIPQKIERGSSPKRVLRSSLSPFAIKAAATLWPAAPVNFAPLK